MGGFMDWKKTFNRGQWVIHAVFIIAVAFSVGITIFSMRLNHLQATEEERTLKINNLLTHLNQDHSFEKIGKFLSWADGSKANDKIRELAQKIIETEELLEIKASEDLSLGLRTFHRLIGNTSGMSDPSDALKVLKSKVVGLNEFAESKKYKSVGQLSSRMKDRLDQLTPKNVGSSIQVSYLQSDIKKAEQVVSSSSLTEAEKTVLLGRITSMQNEVDLLGSLNSQSKDLKAHVTQSSLALAKWLQDVEVKAQNFQSIRERKQDELLILLGGMVAFLVFSWLLAAYVFRWQKGKIGTQVELEVKNVIEKGILSDERHMMDKYSEETRNDIVHLLDELKVKLNLGTMLHNGLPFGGCMIDKNFRLIWQNHIFLEQFYLSEEEVRSDAFNWDYLREYLNLEEDPIYEAMVNKIAGIYPVKVKQDEYALSQPFEMYVTPITVNREDSVMVFFYPLVSVQEAIKDQVNMSKETLGRFITHWKNETLDEDQLKFLEKDFMTNDLEDTFLDLKNLHERLVLEKNEYIKTITELENENETQFEMIEEFKNSNIERKKIIREEGAVANELRDIFLESVERTESLININKTILQQNDDLKTEATKLHNSSLIFNKKTKETIEITSQLETIRGDYKKLKLELLEVKVKLISMNNTLFSQLPPFDENQQKLANRYKDELARLDFNVTTLDKKLGQLDILLTKLNMMYEKGVVEQPAFNFQTSQKDHAMKEALLQIQKAQTASETKVIESFQDLIHLMKKEMAETDSKDSAIDLRVSQ